MPTAAARRALVSAASPQMRPLLELARVTFDRFAGVYRYELVIEDRLPEPSSKREARWHKVHLLSELLDYYQLVVWMDADAMFCAFDRDLADDVPGDCFQALALEVFPTRFNPNSGVWALRGVPSASRFLADVQTIGQPDHSWSDQAAICAALGWALGDYHGHGARPAFPSVHLAGTGWLPPEWNPLGLAARWPGRVRHFAGLPLDERRLAMRTALDELHRRGDL
jgi:hypothetical protein